MFSTTKVLADSAIIHQSYHKKLVDLLRWLCGLRVQTGVHSRPIRRWLLSSIKHKLGKLCKGHSVGNILLSSLHPLRPRQVRFARAVAKEVMSRDRHIGAYTIVFSAYVQYPRLLKLFQGVHSYRPHSPPLGNPPSSTAYLFLYVCQTVVKEC